MQIKPQAGRQEMFLSTPADIAIYGGAAGGGKTWGLLVEPLRHVANPQFDATIFRRTSPEITEAGGLWDESEKLYGNITGTERIDYKLTWRFPSGATVRFRHMQHEKDKLKFKSAQIPLIGFDQLESFTEGQFFYMLSRNRSTCGVAPYIRATVNPDADSWLADFLAWWIDPDDGYPIIERAGVIRYFIQHNDTIIWADEPDDLLIHDRAAMPLSCTFIPSSVYDNQILLEKDPRYIAKLKGMTLVDQERLLGDPKRGGNWKIKPAAGKVFNRDWLRVIPPSAVPELVAVTRGWDLAATEKQLSKGDPDYTVGVLMGKTADGTYIVLDVAEMRQEPAERDATMLATTRADALTYGDLYRVRWEKQPAAAGKSLDRELLRMFSGYDCRSVPPKGDKVVRSSPLASQARGGNVFVMDRAWTKRYLDWLHNFPEGAHDDHVDASGIAYNDLNMPRPGGYKRRNKT